MACLAAVKAGLLAHSMVLVSFPSVAEIRHLLPVHSVLRPSLHRLRLRLHLGIGIGLLLLGPGTPRAEVGDAELAQEDVAVGTDEGGGAPAGAASAAPEFMALRHLDAKLGVQAGGTVLVGGG